MIRKQPPRAIESASKSEDEMNEENTTNSNPKTKKEEITGDEEHTSISTARINNRDPIDQSERSARTSKTTTPRKEIETGPKQISLDTTKWLHK